MRLESSVEAYMVATESASSSSQTPFQLATVYIKLKWISFVSSLTELYIPTPKRKFRQQMLLDSVELRSSN